MLLTRQLATVRAALLFWQEEMAPHGEAFMRQYFEGTLATPLSLEEIADLRAVLNQVIVRYTPA